MSDEYIDDRHAVCVVYAADRAFRVGCDAALRAAGVRVRLASRPAELMKTLGDGSVAAIIVGDDARDADAARDVKTGAVIVRRAPGESIDMIVSRALGVLGLGTNQPRSSE